MADLPWTGGCRCDRVRFRIDQPPMLSSACHCKGCQRMTASAFSISIAVPGEGFTVTQGETVLGGLHADRAQHHFCDWCKSWLFSLAPEIGSFVNVRTSMLDEASDLPPFVEMQTAEKLPWATTPAPHSYERFPPMERFPELIAEYQAQRTRQA